MSDFGSPTYPVARKKYRCAWCGQYILPGEKYFKYAGMWEGDFQDWRMHSECEKAAQAEGIQDGFEPFANARPAA